MTTETQTPGTAAAAETASATPPPASAPAAPAASAPAATAAQPEGQSTLLTDDGAPAAPAEVKTDAPADQKADDAAAPVEYTDFNVPEGVTLNEAAMTSLKEFAQTKNLSQEEAQKLVDMGVQLQQANHERLVQQIEQTQAQWLEASRTDKEFGGDKLNENLTVAKKAMETFGTPELRALLKETGLGNHPEVLRTFYRVGLTIAEDKHVPGTTKPATGRTGAQNLYANSNMNP